MPERDVVAWTAMIAGYASCNHHTRAWVVFRDMMREAWVGGLLVLLTMRFWTCTRRVVSLCWRRAHVFGGILEKNSVSWTTLIAGYTHRGDGYSGLQAFRQMLLEEAETNAFSFSIAGRACASIGSHTTGKQIHAAVIKHGYESNTPVMNSILDMYCKCDLCEAKQCFDGMTERDLITWNTWIAGYEKCDSNESLYIFSQMEYEGFSPNCFTLSSVVAACSNLAVLSCGQQVHGTIIRRGFDRNLALSNALIDIHGYGKQAVELFDQMVKSGLSYFNSMIGDYNLNPNQEIYGCVVDLLARAGRVKEAYEIMEGMPFKPDESVWGAFLGACRAHKHPDVGKLAATRLLDLGRNTAGTYVTLSNIYAAEGKWGEFAKVRKLMRGVGSRKEAGRSWVEVRNQVCDFVVGDKVGAHIEWVYGVLDVLALHMGDAGYVPDLDCLIGGYGRWDLKKMKLNG
ncbi:hypothetical protein Vadar_015144 [Vaccinium darrowii]|uniref:Uncharacterized protein n=1 Tax=Vaccinium darrowii TaxID=229202 RepID=A0ACB7X1B1_9ERIC|nr:hypothetical protein Vadar_015144 [Vaccinium darrowii]